MDERCNRFYRVVTSMQALLMANYAVRGGEWEVWASAEYTAGLTELNTCHGRVRVVSVIHQPGVFEIRAVRS